MTSGTMALVAPKKKAGVRLPLNINLLQQIFLLVVALLAIMLITFG